MLTLAPVDLATAGATHWCSRWPLRAPWMQHGGGGPVAPRRFSSHVSKRAGDRVQMGERLAWSIAMSCACGSPSANSLKQAQAALTVAESNGRSNARSGRPRLHFESGAGQSSESAIVSARSSYDAAKTQMDIAKAALAETALTSPISGHHRQAQLSSPVSGCRDAGVHHSRSGLAGGDRAAAERVAELKIGQKASFQLDAGRQQSMAR